ncbi:hypothetical protein [Roseinatronobacter bogoriensis]|uniref:Uncharacterized protein n=1 Tax=Roseinatronobacter bogoriensis subsp. barguzinensis TaxID=441209 RepID=A0A2K8K6D8_9RHOB|nr:hypothetical protein [Rhodobaca]ATX65014.1 hypothetical protein BG454_03500 [Rhodobaca barguzinensis]MBB4208841.1 hypothetical protein [Rhodobaca bogoriensis DSM 18756]TDW37891.1 hypothetical protein LY39_02245 [Rhodobaca barguzinensis]TDY69939.1 hypothetical protein EV660_103334 [Rhodobaca bogoriensis DSM 18756]
MSDTSPHAHIARPNGVEIRRLEDLRVLRELEGTVDAQDSGSAKPLLHDMPQRLAQCLGKLRLNRGSFGYP